LWRLVHTSFSSIVFQLLQYCDAGTIKFQRPCPHSKLNSPQAHGNNYSANSQLNFEGLIKCYSCSDTCLAVYNTFGVLCFQLLVQRQCEWHSQYPGGLQLVVVSYHIPQVHASLLPSFRQFGFFRLVLKCFVVRQSDTHLISVFGLVILVSTLLPRASPLSSPKNFQRCRFFVVRSNSQPIAFIAYILVAAGSFMCLHMLSGVRPDASMFAVVPASMFAVVPDGAAVSLIGPLAWKYCAGLDTLL
jgi:hypothetical protein